MNFKEWRAWYKSLPIAKKWFIILMLIRPISDNFYDLKEVSVLTSPLYIIGVLTPILILLSLTSKDLRPKYPSPIDFPFQIWAVLTFFNCFYMYTVDLSLTTLGDAIKYTIPFLLFIYARRFIEDKTDLLGVLQTFLYSSIFPSGLILYESIFNPIAIEYLQARGFGSRIRGGYGDIMNYAIYTIGSLIIIFYYYVSQQNKPIYRLKNGVQVISKKWFNTARLSPVWIFIGIGWGLYVLNAIKHVATWGNFLMVIIMLMLFNLRNIKGILIVLGFSLILVPLFAQEIYTKMLEPLVAKEVNVIDGDGQIETLGNGRMTRWEKYFDIWEQMPMANHVFGVSFSGFPEAETMMSLGMHSDYVRNLFISGIIGVVFYVIFMFALLFRGTTMRNFGDKFLVMTCVATVLLYSLSTMPTLYAPFLYLLYCVYAYAILPKERHVY